jgi:hypothetical protein
MAAIKPARYFVVYPQILRTIERRWEGRTGGQVRVGLQTKSGARARRPFA